MAAQNRLADSTSPYLRQHADNPVDWFPWGEEALGRAKREDKPILLSVGYSACHWCHVMAHESFEKPEIAALMNEHFVSVKVDREERPDIDAIYQKVVALMGQGGGWPLTVFLTPDQRPFYGGTYFPPEDRYGRPGFPRLLRALADVWENKREDAEKQAEAFMGGLADIASSFDEGVGAGGGSGLASREARAEAAKRLAQSVDPEWGGFGRAPKFPNVPGLRLLLERARVERAEAEDPAELEGPASAALKLTLDKMWRGGIYDHLRGGFARYSTDREWLIPHFEKMLYDNGLLLELYAEASALFEDMRDELRRVVEQTADYLVADMRDDSGAFYSATDADSEGVEGKYFCWTPAQLESVLGEQLGPTFARAYGVTPQGNFEHGMSALHLSQPLPSVLDDELAPARVKLLEHRYGRVPPLRDEKVLTAWNALVISGFCRAAEVAEVAESWEGADERAAQWRALARDACATILDRHRDDQGRLLRASWQGRGHTRAYLEDLALLARACLDLHELELEPRWHAEAEALAREILDHYAREGGGFYTTADDGEQLIERTESQHDSPLPSGVATTVEVLARLELGGPAGHQPPAGARSQIEQTLARFAAAAARPTAFAGLISAARWAGEDAVHVTIRAASSDAGRALAQVVRRARLEQLPRPVALSFMEVEGKDQPDALICRAQTCSMPIADPQALREQL